MKVLLWIIGVPVCIFAAFFLFFFVKELGDKRSPWEKIEQACNDEFHNRGEFAINDCKIRLGIKRLEDSENSALSRAERRSR